MEENKNVNVNEVNGNETETKAPETPVTPDKPEKKDGILKKVGNGISKIGKGAVNVVKSVGPAIGEGVSVGLSLATSVVVAGGALMLIGKVVGIGNEDCEDDDLKIVDEGPSVKVAENTEPEIEVVEPETETIEF